MAYDFLCVIKMMIFSVITFATHTDTLSTHSFAYNIPGNDTANQKQQISRNIRPSLLFTLWLIVYLVDIIFQIVINRWFFVCAFFAIALFFSLFPTKFLASRLRRGPDDNVDVRKCIRLELCKFDGHCAECHHIHSTNSTHIETISTNHSDWWLYVYCNISRIRSQFHWEPGPIWMMLFLLIHKHLWVLGLLLPFQFQETTNLLCHINTNSKPKKTHKQILFE